MADVSTVKWCQSIYLRVLCLFGCVSLLRIIIVGFVLQRSSTFGWQQVHLYVRAHTQMS
jgi:hypothetical protein